MIKSHPQKALCAPERAPSAAVRAYHPAIPRYTSHENSHDAAPRTPVLTPVMKPRCIDLFCGLGGWTDGFLAEGWDCIGFDIEHHVYGDHYYRGQLVLQDVRTLHGSQFKDADMIVASSPCQEFSYRAMPWTRARALGPPELGMELFAQAARIQAEASAAAGRHIPMVQENVCGAQKWVGRARWHYGSYYLWGDVPALMPIVVGRPVMKEGVTRRANGETNFHGSARRATKNTGGPWFAVAHNTTSGHSRNPAHKVGGFRFDGSGGSFQRSEEHTSEL